MAAKRLQPDDHISILGFSVKEAAHLLLLARSACCLALLELPELSVHVRGQIWIQLLDQLEVSCCSSVVVQSCVGSASPVDCLCVQG